MQKKEQSVLNGLPDRVGRLSKRGVARVWSWCGDARRTDEIGRGASSSRGCCSFVVAIYNTTSIMDALDVSRLKEGEVNLGVSWMSRETSRQSISSLLI